MRFVFTNRSKYCKLGSYPIPSEICPYKSLKLKSMNIMLLMFRSHIGNFDCIVVTRNVEDR